MYHLSDDNLDKLFGPLKDLEREPDAALWSDISQQLPEPGFMNWGLKHFNVYYVGSGIAALLVLFFTLQKQPTPNTQKQVIQVTDEKVQKETDTVVHEPELKHPEKRTVPVVKNKEEKEKPVPQDTSESFLVPVPIVDVPEPIQKQADTMSVVQIKPKKIVKIVRRDTLHVKDTVAVKRRRRDK